MRIIHSLCCFFFVSETEWWSSFAAQVTVTAVTAAEKATPFFIASLLPYNYYTDELTFYLFDMILKVMHYDFKNTDL